MPQWRTHRQRERANRSIFIGSERFHIENLLHPYPQDNPLWFHTATPLFPNKSHHHGHRHPYARTLRLQRKFEVPDGVACSVGGARTRRGDPAERVPGGRDVGGHEPWRRRESLWGVQQRGGDGGEGEGGWVEQQRGGGEGEEGAARSGVWSASLPLLQWWERWCYLPGTSSENRTLISEISNVFVCRVCEMR